MVVVASEMVACGGRNEPLKLAAGGVYVGLLCFSSTEKMAELMGIYGRDDGDAGGSKVVLPLLTEMERERTMAADF